MNEPAKVDWIARGRHQQWSSRPIHALFCFKRAIERMPRDGDARFHLGEVLWQLGRVEQAKAEWREATVRAPRPVLGRREITRRSGRPSAPCTGP